MLKLFGVIFIIAGCGGVGFRLAANHKKEERTIRQLIEIIDFMACELQYRLTPLPDLCREVAKQFPSTLSDVFSELALEMDAQLFSDMSICMAVVLNKNRTLPQISRSQLELLGKSIGRFDLEGQLKGLNTVCEECKRKLKILANNRESRLRSYQTLGLCAGAALAILLI